MTKHLVLWDGDCGFCRRSVQWVQRHDTRHRFEFTPYQQAPSPPMTPELFAACEHAVHVVKTDGTILRAGKAALFLLEGSGHRRLARTLGQPLFLPFVEWGYRIIANHRIFFSRFLFRSK